MFLPQRHEEHERKLRFLLPWFVSSQTNCITIPIYIFLPRSNKGLEGKTSFFSSCAAGVSMYCCCSIVIPKGWHVYSKHCVRWCSTPKVSYIVLMNPCYKDLNPSDSFFNVLSIQSVSCCCNLFLLLPRLIFYIAHGLNRGLWV